MSRFPQNHPEPGHTATDMALKAQVRRRRDKLREVRGRPCRRKGRKVGALAGARPAEAGFPGACAGAAPS